MNVTIKLSKEEDEKYLKEFNRLFGGETYRSAYGDDQRVPGKDGLKKTALLR